MTYSLDASGQTGNGGDLKDLWDANSPGDGLFIQNRSVSKLTVVVTPTSVGGQPPVNPILIDLPAGGDYVLDATVIAIDAQVQVRSQAAGATYTAFRTQS